MSYISSDPIFSPTGLPLESPVKPKDSNSKRENSKPVDQGNGTSLSRNFTVRRKLNEDETNDLEARSQAKTVQNISKIYNFNFNSSLQVTRAPFSLSQLNDAQRETIVREDAKKAEVLKGQVEEIEKILDRLNSAELTLNCRTRVRTLLYLDNYETKMAELGMILFYLDCKSDIPDTDSFLAFRASAMQQEVESYINNHKALEMHPLIPSGKIQYLLRAFAHMTFTSNQVHNRGGLFAIQELLTNPLHKISMYLQPEHASHILNAIHNIISDNAFDTLFANKIVIHPSMAEAVRLDLKLAEDAEVESIHVFYACMIAIFTDVRQGGAPNCYAVATLKYATENHTFIILEILIKWLTDGCYHLSATLKMPLRPLLEKRLTYSNDFELMVNADKAQESFLIQHMQAILELESPELEHSPSMPLRDLLQRTLERNMSTGKKSYAEKLYNSYKCSALVQLQLAINEFVYMNSNKGAGRNRYELIETIIKAIESGLRVNMPAQFRRLFIERLGEVLWFENCNDGDVRIENNFLFVGTRRINRFSGNLNELCSLFKNSLRVFSLTKDVNRNDVYNLIWSISDLNQVLHQVFNQTAREFTYKGSTLGNLCSQVQSSIGSREYRRILTSFCANQIKKHKAISAKNLNDADFLIFNQTGGNAETCLNIVYDIEVATAYIDNCYAPTDFLKSMLLWIETLNPSVLLTIPRFMIITKNVHAWTLAPSCWSLLIKHKNDFDKIMKEIVFEPAKKRLNSIVPSEVIERVIVRHACNEEVVDAMREHFNPTMSRHLTFIEFKRELYRNIRPNERGNIDNIIDEEFSMVTLDQSDLIETLRILGIVNLPQAILSGIFQAVSGVNAHPFVLAEKLRVALIEAAVNIVDPFQLEMSICHVRNLPFSIQMGDSNWTDEHTEDARHIAIVNKFSYVRNGLCYCIRSGNSEFLESNDEYVHFQIQYPVDMVHK